jgi:hypothetical protein
MVAVVSLLGHGLRATSRSLKDLRPARLQRTTNGNLCSMAKTHDQPNDRGGAGRGLLTYLLL